MTMVCGSYGVGKTGLDVDFLNGKRQGLVDGINVIEFDVAYSNSDSFTKRTLSFVKYAASSLVLALTLKYDLVFATSTPLTAGIPGIAAKIFRGKPFVFEVRDLWPELPREMGVIKNRAVLLAMSALEWTSYHTASSCIGLSPGIVEGIVRRGISRDKVRMIPNGCDLDAFDPDLPGRWRPEGIKPDNYLAVFTGTHGIANGLDAVLDAALELKRRGIDNIKIVMIGHGKQKPALMHRAATENLDNCIFLDSVPKNRLADLLREADIGLMILANIPAFYFGTSPNKFFDYIAAGLPVLNNYPGWLAEMIKENDLGYTVPPDDPILFADALVKAQLTGSTKEDGRNPAREFAISRFAWADLAIDFEDSLLHAVDIKN